jgi:hypothetical protein
MTTLIEEYLRYDRVRRVELRADPQFSNLHPSILTSLIKSEWDAMREDERASFRQSNLESTCSQSAAGSTSANSGKNLSISVDIPTVTPPKPASWQSPGGDSAVGERDDNNDNVSVESLKSESPSKLVKVTHVAEP